MARMAKKVDCAGYCSLILLPQTSKAILLSLSYSAPLRADVCKLPASSFRLGLVKGRYQQMTKGWEKKTRRKRVWAFSVLPLPCLHVCGSCLGLG